MDVLFIGGSGQISGSCVTEAVSAGHRVWVFNRGQSPMAPPTGVTSIVGDFNDDASYAQLKGRTFDVVCQFLVYDAAQMARDIEIFAGSVGQYIFISTASAYHKPVTHFRITEDVALHNPHWAYSRHKAAVERALQNQADLAYTIVRPSHTLRTQLATAMGERDLVARRLLHGAPVVVPGDGESIWTITRAEDFAPPFVRLFGADGAMNDHFHLTGDAGFTWNRIYGALAEALGVRAEIVGVPSATLIRFNPDWEGPLLGDECYSVLFDNTKIKAVVGDFDCARDVATILASPLAHFRERTAHPAPDTAALDHLLDAVIRAQRSLMPAP